MMGAFIIFDIGFEKEKDRKRFEEKYKIRKKHILVDEYSNSYGFIAWTVLRDVNVNPIYNMGFMGYGEPKDILNECLKEGIKIKFLAWLPINDRRAEWEKIRGRW